MGPRRSSWVTCLGVNSSSECAQQFHRADDLVGEDVDGAVDAFTSSGHQAVEVGAADQGELGAQGDGGDDVGAVHDPGVDNHFHVLAHFAGYFGQEVEGDRCAVELAAAVVGQHDPVDARSASLRESSRVWTPLMAILPGHISRMMRRSS